MSVIKRLIDEANHGTEHDVAAFTVLLVMLIAAIMLFVMLTVIIFEHTGLFVGWMWIIATVGGGLYKGTKFALSGRNG